MKSFYFEFIKTLYYFHRNYIPNHFINKIPFYFIRHFFYRNIYRLKLGKGSSIHLNCFINRFNIEIGKDTAINRKCYLDGRGGILIGDNVSISPEVHLITAQHSINDSSFTFVKESIVLDDYVFIGTRAIVLPGVHLGKGCVVASGAVVTKSFPEYSIVAGVPAKIISTRNKKLNYSCKWMPPFD
jgi:acetyltransferase-like isoleucine patch superfamily enzyme